MKKVLFSWLLSTVFLTTINAQYGSERTGYEGDYFSLEGAIEVFKESNSLRNFERNLNRQDAYVNNLDLNYDGEIDYVRVEHRNQGEFHAIILQVAVSRRDIQDIAVIEIERTGNRRAILQIIGDPDVYGEEVIAEPFRADGYSSRGDYDFSRGYVNVFYWPAVQNIMRRDYVTYVSPYRWNYYPTYWSPWRPLAWSVYHPRRVRYFNFCHIVYVHRVVRVHNFYRPNRRFSSFVAQRTVGHRQKFGRTVAHRSFGKQRATFRAPARSNRVATQSRTRSNVNAGNVRRSNVTNRTTSPRNAQVQRNQSGSINRGNSSNTVRNSRASTNNNVNRSNNTRVERNSTNDRNVNRNAPSRTNRAATSSSRSSQSRSNTVTRSTRNSSGSKQGSVRNQNKTKSATTNRSQNRKSTSINRSSSASKKATSASKRSSSTQTKRKGRGS